MLRGHIALASTFAGVAVFRSMARSSPASLSPRPPGTACIRQLFNHDQAIAILIVAVTFGLSTATRFLGESFVISGALVISSP